MNPGSYIAPQAFHFLLKVVQLTETLKFTEVRKCQRVTWKTFSLWLTLNSWLSWYRISSVLVSLTLLCLTQLLKGSGSHKEKPPSSVWASNLPRTTYILIFLRLLLSLPALFVIYWKVSCGQGKWGEQTSELQPDNQIFQGDTHSLFQFLCKRQIQYSSCLQNLIYNKPRSLPSQERPWRYKRGGHSL